ncbi:MAG: TIGR00282 family metallophosphoesterase [Candidatus Omnitrophica bacterium]|nr:TIGR00282 family metallophosphoesterase [Candidatus Omnitrophota bacterium]
MKILIGGDVVGKPGRKACAEVIPQIKREEKIDFVIINAENAAGGSGITEATTEELFGCGIDCLTTGDHVFKKKEAEQLIQEDHRILRPANFPSMVPGEGKGIYQTRTGIKIGVINLIGRVFLKTVECPFETARKLVEELRNKVDIIVVDFHAEATSEKIAMGWYLDGKVSGIFGTHTHVQTADETILPQGTAYITDVGMCGPYKSIIGRDIESVLHMFITQMPARFEMAKDDVRFSGVIFEMDLDEKRAVSVKRIHRRVE